MLKYLELKNFESHKHTVLRDLSDGFNLIQGASNVGKCLTGDTIILDKDGSMRTILDMFKQGDWSVPSIKDGKCSFERVSGISANGNKPVFALETRRGRKIKATANHKFFTPSGWRMLSELNAGDWVAIARRLPVFGSKKLPEGHARLIGYLLGDGGTIQRLNFTNEEQDVLDDFRRLTLAIEGHHFETKPSGNATTIYPSKPLDTENRNVGKSGLAKFCDDYGLFGHKHNTKSIPEIIFTCCEEDIKDLLLGLFITDGWVHRRKNINSFEVCFCTTSSVMACQIAHLLTRFGIVSTMRRKKTSWEYMGEKKKGWAYSIDVHGRRFVRTFGDVFGYSFTGKKSELLRQAVQFYDMDRTICRYDGIPRTKEMIETVQKAVHKSGKSIARIRKEMGLSHSTSLEGSCRNETFGMTFLEKLAHSTGSKELRKIVDSDLYYDRIKSITPAGIEPTFDIEVPKTHTFFANDIYTHNTAMIRALRLVAYNQFDPKSVRVGESKCEVIVETERGRVRVVRGPKTNSWEVTPVGGITQNFDKVGKQIIPEAARIIGLNIVRLGDADIPVNIMEQLESHFMLASVGSQDASGSLRAQVIDEISGLSGIEGVIKDVSLDNHRFGREIKETELSMQETCKQLHNADELRQEGETLGKAEESLVHGNECLKIREDAKTLLEGWSAGRAESEGVKNRLSQIPDLDAVQSKLVAANKTLGKLDKAGGVCVDANNASQKAKTTQNALRVIPDTDRATGLLRHAQEQADAAIAMRDTVDTYNGTSERIDATMERVTGIGDTDEAIALLGHFKTHRDNAQGVKKLLDEMNLVQDNIRKTKDLLQDCESEISAQEAEKDALLKEIKVCPLTLGPVSPECIQKAREQ